MACFARSGDDNFARAMENHDLLDFYALGTRRGARGVSPEHTRLKPIFGLANYLAAMCLPTFQAESFRFRLFGLFGRWVRSLLKPGQPLFTAYAFANEAIRWAKQHGAPVLIDAWTSHPREFWDLLTVEQQRWGSRYPPGSRYYQERALETAALADFVFTPSTFVRNSFLRQGFAEDRLLLCPYPVDMEAFTPPTEPRPADRPLTLLHTGAVSFRKGTPDLLEAFRILRRQEPTAVLRLSRAIRNEMRDVLRRYADLPIEWTGHVDLPAHVRRYQTSDVLVFPSLEDGFALVVAEALACGLPVITTPNTGASDLIQPGENGEVVPIRSPERIAEAVLKWWARIRAGHRPTGRTELQRRLGFETFERTFLGHVKRIGLVEQQA